MSTNDEPGHVGTEAEIFRQDYNIFLIGYVTHPTDSVKTIHPPSKLEVPAQFLELYRDTVGYGLDNFVWANASPSS